MGVTKKRVVASADSRYSPIASVSASIITDNSKHSIADSGSIVTQETKLELKKQMNLFHCVSIIIGIIVGAGIFVSPVGITVHVRSVGMSIVMWGVAGLFSMLCALCYAELGACLPESGGEYIYIKRAWGDFAAFMSLWMNFIIINPVCVAASTLVFATYVIRPLFPDCEPPEAAVRLFAALIIAVIVGLNCYNVTLVTKLQMIITASKLIALLIIVSIGFYWLGKGHVENFQETFADSDTSVGAISLAFYSGFWAFGGWSYLNYLTDEVINPHRNLPLGIMISITAITLIYILANIAYFAVLTPMELLQSSAVAVTFLERTVRLMSYVVPSLIAVSVIGGINGSVLSMSRLFYVAAKNNHLPSIISMIQVKNCTPSPSLIAMLVLVVIMQCLGNIFFLIEMLGFSLSILLATVFGGQVFLRYTEPNLHRPIKLPWILPAFLCCVCMALMGITVYQKPWESSIALVIIVSGVPAYILGTKWRKPHGVQTFIDGITMTLQKLLLVSACD
ncbi:unnamed protein product [Candidula unifasciata]|uniref:Y+L amino acid transporter 2 n=1 Tax=Candidula unifasciata TaxID=100452 RepID=A0A8S3YW89_9EUPU|nr:unnamed protein product [Candidula unifasciata]